MLEILAGTEMPGANAPADTFPLDYFTRLRGLETTASAQLEPLRKLGWQAVPVPSMPDFYCSRAVLSAFLTGFAGVQATKRLCRLRAWKSAARC